VHIGNVELEFQFTGSGKVQTDAPDAWLHDATSEADAKPVTWEDITPSESATDRRWKATVAVNEDLPIGVSKDIYFGDASYYFGSDPGPKATNMHINGKFDADGNFELPSLLARGIYMV